MKTSNASRPVLQRAGIPFGVLISRYRRSSKKKKKDATSSKRRSQTSPNIKQWHPDRKEYFELTYDPKVRDIGKRLLPANTRQARGITIKRSKRWIDTEPVVRQWFEIPHIDKLGKFTGLSVYTLQCTPRDVHSTTVATIFGRLKRHVSYHNKKNVVGSQLRLLMGCASYYALSKNSYFMDRFLFLSKRWKDNGRTIQGLLTKCLAKCDANKRFVHSQVCYQTNWLYLRACRPRDKSHYKFTKKQAERQCISVESVSASKAVRSSITNLLCGERYSLTR